METYHATFKNGWTFIYNVYLVSSIHVTVLILLKGVLFARNSRLVPDKSTLGFRFPCDGPGRGGTCQISAWDHIFLGLFWMVRLVFNTQLKFLFFIIVTV